MTVSLNLDRGAFNLGGAQQTLPSTRTGGGERPQNMEAALNALVKSMTDSQNKVNGDSPLLKLLTELLENLENKGAQAQGGGNAPGSGMSLKDMSPDQLKEVLSQLLQALGGGGGAGAGGNGFGGGAGAGAGGNGLGGGAAGGGDILSQLLGALAQQKLDGMLQPANDGQGSMNFKSGDKELLKEVANFMDQAGFPKPDDASGKGVVKSWADELTEKTPDGKDDFKLSAEEAGQFQKALDMLGSQAASGNAPASGMLANSGIPLASGEGRGNGGGGFGGGVGNGGGFGGGATVTMSVDDLRELLQSPGAGGAAQGGGPTAQERATVEDARNAAGSIMNKLFS